MNFYRYEDFPSNDGVSITLLTIPVEKTTPCGAWLDYHGTKKFVLLSANKRYACPTIEEAKESYLARKRRQVKILTAQLSRAEKALRLAEEGKFMEPSPNSFLFI